MNKVIITLCLVLNAFFGLAQCGNLYISGVLDGDLAGGLPKAIQVCASGDISDLSIYSFGIAFNGGGVPATPLNIFNGSIITGECIWISSEISNFTNYFGFAPDIPSALFQVNGDDSPIVFCNGLIEDVYGDPTLDGTGTCWEYSDGYGVNNNSGPNFGTFDCSNYSFGSVDGISDYASIPGDPFQLNGGGGVNPSSCINFLCSDLEIFAVTINSENDNWDCSSNSWTANGYIGSSSPNEISDLWLIGGSYDLTSATTVSLIMDADETFAGNSLSLFYTTSYTGCPSDAANVWQNLGDIASGGEGTGLTFDLSSAAGYANVYFAVNYYSLSDAGTSSQWELSNIKLEADNCPLVNTAVVSDCTPCSVSNAAYSGACVGLDYNYEVNFNYAGAGNFEVIDIATNQVLASGTDSPITITIADNSSTIPFNVLVRSADEITCVSNLLTIEPMDCSNNIPCNPSVGVFPWNGQ